MCSVSSEDRAESMAANVARTPPFGVMTMVCHSLLCDVARLIDIDGPYIQDGDEELREWVLMVKGGLNVGMGWRLDGT